MSNILTLTMNPAIDLSTSTQAVEPVRKLRCGATRREAGGGGINVARVAQRLGAHVTALYPVGGFVGQMLERLVEGEGVRSVGTPIAGDTREDFTVLDERTGQQYRFVLPGPQISEPEWTLCLARLADLAPDCDFVCASGSLPPGVPEDFYARAAEVVRGRGAKFVVDTSGAALRATLKTKLYLVKPNLRELQDLTGATLDDQASLLRACRELISPNGAEVVALTLGSDGAMLVTADRAWRAPALPVRVASTVGAGDSFLGAMVWALASESGLEAAFRHAMAGGAAALLAPGTGLAHAVDVRQLVDQVTIQGLSET
ncbi:1-phosphofructokinase family hexose kinase [Phenylobacterium haematophilum]|jgi:6-phosphofructokinase 2|nr:1-phosphofructokinase family hexose kinase [Phenylobacterium haematophilum]